MIVVLSPSQAVKRPGLLAVISTPDEPAGHLRHIGRTEGINVTKFALNLIQNSVHLGVQPRGAGGHH